MTVRKLKEDYKHKAIFWTEQINEINSLSKEQLLELVNYIALLNGGIIFNDKEED